MWIDGLSKFPVCVVGKAIANISTVHAASVNAVDDFSRSILKESVSKLNY